MLTKIEALDGFGNTLSLPLQDVSAGYTVKSIDGLDPVKATISSSSFAQLDGAQFQGARREPRNIIIKLGMEPYSGGSTVRTLRATLYKYFMPKAFVTLKFYDDGSSIPTALITGQVETMETPLFAKDPEVNISILCADPAFYGPTELSVTGNTHDPSGATDTTINYAGTLEVGYRLVIPVNRTMSTGLTVLLKRFGASVYEKVDITAALANLDVVEISTLAKNKYVKNTKSPGSSLLYAVTVASRFAPLYPGVNYFRIDASGAAVPWTLYYTPRYGGL